MEFLLIPAMLLKALCFSSALLHGASEIGPTCDQEGHVRPRIMVQRYIKPGFDLAKKTFSAAYLMRENARLATEKAKAKVLKADSQEDAS